MYDKYSKLRYQVWIINIGEEKRLLFISKLVSEGEAFCWRPTLKIFLDFGPQLFRFRHY